jgi:hypothetical protein
MSRFLVALAFCGLVTADNLYAQCALTLAGTTSGYSNINFTPLGAPPGNVSGNGTIMGGNPSYVTEEQCQMATPIGILKQNRCSRIHRIRL